VPHARRHPDLTIGATYGRWLVLRAAWNTHRHRQYAVRSTCCGHEALRTIGYLLGQVKKPGRCWECKDEAARDAARKVEAQP
jgi:hypothetical protein